MAIENNVTMQGVSTYETADTTKTKKKSGTYGKTVGQPELSEKAQKYYEDLKKRYGNYDFVLVSRDEKANAQMNAAKYANPGKTVVLIDEDKIEKMATDANYRKKYEDILSGASSQLAQMKESMKNSGANVQGFGMQVNDDGTTSFFAVLKKSSADQKVRMEKSAAKKKAAKKEAEKKAAKKAQEERLKGDKSQRPDKETAIGEDDEMVTIKANSVEELMSKIGEFSQNERMNSVQTDAEKMVGQHFDFKG